MRAHCGADGTASAGGLRLPHAILRVRLHRFAVDGSDRGTALIRARDDAEARDRADSLAEGASYIALGPGVAADAAQASLKRLLGRGGLQHLSAVREGRAHAIWHGFYNSPFNVVAVQVFAKWLHPEAFADLDPQRTLERFYGEFQPVALDGQYWISL